MSEEPKGETPTTAAGWKLWRVPIKTGVDYFRIVRAPSASDAARWVDEQLENGRLVPTQDEELKGGYCEAISDETGEAPEEAHVHGVYGEEPCPHDDVRTEDGVTTCDACGEEL